MPKAKDPGQNTDPEDSLAPDDIDSVAYRPFWVHPNVWQPIQKVADDHGVQAQAVFTYVLHEGMDALDDFEAHMAQSDDD